MRPNILSLVRGNTAMIRATLTETANGQEQSVDIQGYDSWHVNIRQVSPCQVLYDDIPQALTDEGEIAIQLPHTLPTGRYSVEVLLEHGTARRRSYETPAFRIVEGNSEAYVTYDVIDGARSADLIMRFQLVESSVLRGKNAYELWREQPGNENKTLQEYIDSFIRNEDGAVHKRHISGVDFTANDTFERMQDTEGGFLNLVGHSPLGRRFLRIGKNDDGKKQFLLAAGFDDSPDTDENLGTQNSIIISVTEGGSTSLGDGKGRKWGQINEAGELLIGLPGSSAGDGGQSEVCFRLYKTELSGRREVELKTYDPDGQDEFGTIHLLPGVMVRYQKDSAYMESKETDDSDTRIWRIRVGKDIFHLRGYDVEIKRDQSGNLVLSRGDCMVTIGDQIRLKVNGNTVMQVSESNVKSYIPLQVVNGKNVKGYSDSNGKVNTWEINSASGKLKVNAVQIAGKDNTHVVLAGGGTAVIAKVATTGSYNDLSDRPTIPTVPRNVSEMNNDAGYISQHQDISGKEDRMPIVTVQSVTGNVLSIQANRLYRVTPDVGTLNVTLNAPADNSYTSLYTLMLRTGASPAITFTAADGLPIYYPEDYALAASTLYEISVMYDGTGYLLRYASYMEGGAA